MSKIIHAVAAKAAKKSDTSFVVTLDGIDKTYFNASADGLISSDGPGILKLKKHPDSANQTVYIKTSKRDQPANLDDKVIKQPTCNVTDNNQVSQKSSSSSDSRSKAASPAKAAAAAAPASAAKALPVKTLEERRESLNRSAASGHEKPKAMVAPLRNSTSNNTSSTSQSN